MPLGAAARANRPARCRQSARRSTLLLHRVPIWPTRHRDRQGWQLDHDAADAEAKRQDRIKALWRGLGVELQGLAARASRGGVCDRQSCCRAIQRYRELAAALLAVHAVEVVYDQPGTLALRDQEVAAEVARLMAERGLSKVKAIAAVEIEQRRGLPVDPSARYRAVIRGGGKRSAKRPVKHSGV